MFGEIRSAAQRAPGEAAWEAICAAVEAVEPARLREEVVPYLNAHLRHWPDAARRVPARWLRALWRGEPAPIEALAITRRLELRGGVRATELAALARLPQLGGLSSLALRSCGLRAADLVALEGAPLWASLTSLDLSHNALNREAMRALAPWLARGHLEHLTLAWNFITDAGAEALLGGEVADAPFGDALLTLDLSNNHLGERPDVCARWLVSAMRRLPALHTLRLGWNALGDAGLRALLRAPWPTTLRALDLSENGLTDAGAQALLDDPRVGQLLTLDLFGNALGIASAEAVATSAHLSDLRELELSANPIGHAGRRLIMRAAHLPLRLRRQAEDWERLEPDDEDEPLDM